MRFLSRFPFTIAALILGGTLTVLVLTTDLDLIKTSIVELERVNDKNIDDLFASLLLVALGAGLDALRLRRRFDLEARELAVLKATMRTVQDLVGNALNNLLLFRMEAEPHVSTEALRQFDAIIRDTADKLSQLGSVRIVVEKPMAGGAGIQYEPSQTPPHR